MSSRVDGPEYRRRKNEGLHDDDSRSAASDSRAAERRSRAAWLRRTHGREQPDSGLSRRLDQSGDDQRKQRPASRYATHENDPASPRRIDLRSAGEGLGRGEATREDRDGNDGKETGIVGAIKSRSRDRAQLASGASINREQREVKYAEHTSHSRVGGSGHLSWCVGVPASHGAAVCNEGSRAETDSVQNRRGPS